MTRNPFPPGHSLIPAPAFRLAFCFASGIVIGSRAHIPGAVWVCSCIALSLLTAIGVRRTVCHGAPLSLIAGLLLLSSGALKFAVDSPLSPSLPEPPFARSVLLTGNVVGPPQDAGGRITFTLFADSCYSAGRGGPLQCRIAVTIRREKGEGGACPVSYGMTLLARGSISAPPAERNPGEFSLRKYYGSMGIMGVLSVDGLTGIVIRDTAGGTWFMKKWIYPIRGSILRRVGESLPGLQGEFLKDLLLGERSGIPGETKEAFIDAGVAHVLAVSGYRVIVVAGMLMGAMSLFRVPRRLRPLIAAPALLFYMVLALGQVPVVRGTVMTLVFLLGGVVQRRTNSRNAIGVAALLVLVADSRQLFDAGFQLSFGAVIAILYFMPPVRSPVSRPGVRGSISRTTRWVFRSIAVSLVVSLGTLPITAACFGRVSLVGVLTNIAVVPATGAGMILGTISLTAGLISPPLGAAYAALNGLLLDWTIRFSVYAASLPFASLETGRLGPWEAIPWYAAMALATHWRNRRQAARLLALLLAGLNALLFLPADPAYARSRDSLRVSMIDVGQGDAILVEFPGGETLLVDTGPLTLAGNAGKKIVTPFLKRRGIGAIDLLVITHPDADHCGGAASVLRSFPVRRVIESVAGGGAALYDSYHAAALARGSPVSLTRRGEAIAAADCARIYVLWPPCPGTSSWAETRRSGSNNASIVFKLVYGGVSFLFTGDAEKESEHELIRSFGGFLRSTVLKVAHHGSDSGTSQEFLDAVRPSLALISVGIHNRFRHPSPSLLVRLQAAGAGVLRTDREGAVVLTSDGRSVQEIAWR
jgi:competence protein ComEC